MKQILAAVNANRLHHGLIGRCQVSSAFQASSSSASSCSSSSARSASRRWGARSDAVRASSRTRSPDTTRSRRSRARSSLRARRRSSLDDDAVGCRAAPYGVRRLSPRDMSRGQTPGHVLQGRAPSIGARDPASLRPRTRPVTAFSVMAAGLTPGHGVNRTAVPSAGAGLSQGVSEGRSAAFEPGRQRYAERPRDGRVR